MRIPKQYGKSKVEKCPFCEDPATTLNRQGLTVCRKHSHAKLGDMKCVCGKYTELKTGKWGAYFSCLRCGNVAAKKIFEINQVVDVSQNATAFSNSKKQNAQKQRRKEPTEITIRSDDPRYFN